MTGLGASALVLLLQAAPPPAPPAPPALVRVPPPIYYVAPPPAPPAPPPPPLPPDLAIVERPDAARFYPRKAHQDGVAGTVRVALGVRFDGKVTRCAVRNGSGSAALDAAACKLARRLRFETGPDAARTPKAERPCCTLVEIAWRDGNARVISLATPRQAILPRLGSLVQEIDYPVAAMRANEQGIVHFAVEIGTSGRATGCAIVQSSGSAALDAATCRILRARIHATPARNEYGEAVPETVHSRITWRLRDEPSAPPAK